MFPCGVRGQFVNSIQLKNYCLETLEHWDHCESTWGLAAEVARPMRLPAAPKGPPPPPPVPPPGATDPCHCAFYCSYCSWFWPLVSILSPEHVSFLLGVAVCKPHCEGTQWCWQHCATKAKANCPKAPVMAPALQPIRPSCSSPLTPVHAAPVHAAPPPPPPPKARGHMSVGSTDAVAKQESEQEASSYVTSLQQNLVLFTYLWFTCAWVCFYNVFC